MELLLISLFIMFLSGMGFLLSLNYSLYQWEDKRINNLTDQIKGGEANEILKSRTDRSFSAYDVSSKMSGVNQKYQNALVLFKDSQYPRWFEKTRKIVKALKTNTWNTIKSFFKYISHITSPSALVTIKDIRREKYIKEQEKEKLTEIDEVIDSVIGSKKGKDSQDLKDELEEKSKTENAEKLVALEKMEGRILSTLRESGFDNYDIWLELGQLYLDFDENDKAKEVFKLILKHSSGKEKELARNKLYSLC